MFAADVGVVERDRALGKPAEGEAVLPEHDLLPVGEMQHAGGAIGLLHAGVDAQLAGPDIGALGQDDLHGAHEVPAVVASGFTSGLAKLADKRLLDVGETSQVGLVESDLEVVGHNGLPLHADRAGIGHLAHEAVPNFHRSHAAAEETSDGAVDQPFESSLD